MLSPILVALLYYAVTIIYILIWRSLAMELVWAQLKLQAGKAWRCSREHFKRTSGRAGTELQDQLVGCDGDEQEREPEPLNTNSGVLDTEYENGHKWQFRAWINGTGCWQDFGPAEQRKLADAKLDGARRLVLEREGFEYEIDLQQLVQKNKSTGRQRKIRAPAYNLFYRYRFTRSFLQHSWGASRSGVIRLLLLYLLVGYTFLAGTSVEPIACQRDIDMSSWIEAAPSIECDWCKGVEQSDGNDGNDTSSGSAGAGPDGNYVGEFLHIPVTYMQLASASIAFFTLYGFGTPILFAIILVSHRDVLQSNQFVKRYGFLVTKMKTEYYL